MIFPTLLIQVYKKAGNDLQGQPLFARPYGEKVAPAKLKFTIQHTTVRTDSAASKGHAEEVVADVVLLAIPKTRIALDDMLVVMGRKVRVVIIHPRHTVTGQLDHIQVHCTAWV